jgi:serine/threonine protein kinase
MNNYTDSENSASISNAHQWSRSAENEFESPIVHAHNPEAGINADILGVLDANTLTTFQFSLRRLGRINRRFPLGSVVLGRGLSFVVRRVLFDDLYHFDISSSEREPANSKFVVLKQPLASENRGPDDVNRLRAVLLEMKILRHKPIAEHPNIVRLLQLRWDTQDGPALIAPTLVLEHADLGSLAGFQDPGRLILCSDTKRTICLDIARGLQALHSCGIVHGDVKSE